MTAEKNDSNAVALQEATRAEVEATTDIRQFVTFIVGDEVFAVDMAPVQEIIRVPEVVKVPLAPRTLDGLANLRGKVLPIISLRRIFGFDERVADDASRAVVIDQGRQPLGFVVDRVVSVVGVDPRHIEGTAAISSTVNTELVSGLLKDVGGYPMIMVLDFGKLIANEFADIAVKAGNHTEIATQAAARPDAQQDKINDELHLVNFEVADQEYAIVIDDVQEIVQVPELIVHVPHSESHVLGVMTLRNRLLPLVSLRRMFGLPTREADENSRIVVVSLGTASVGVVMDSVNEVLRVARTDVDAMPAMLSKEGNLSDISQICRLDSGKRLVSILSVGNMFRHTAIKEALATVDNMADQDAQQGTAVSAKRSDDDRSDDEEQVVVFVLGKEEFGVPIDSVQEIVRVAEAMTRVPKAPPAVEGVINLRGAVLPVMDLRRRLGLEQIARSDRQRIMVFLIDGVRTGFIVDSVVEVLKVHKTTIEPAPHLSGEQSMLLARMANLEKQKRMVQLLDPSYLIEKQELQALAQLAAA
ncbi:chemotaxis protein CheW [Actimicrobium sp. CCC2.4]|uniref:chemotaxis protein CheW n=1 Tax=Actimicrobium sp. CCC2.4 TaxID=3048606 RepID=UPI002AC90B23|nr:chemotaxis protein CheW [Actimicrobium sp. CCC2.4]MEB0133715.1 chemotaxis protein CheW [Actimicrobium sp. CCC2.4]WPX31262.1 chemotaxis protein CheW [Actimicrobium sp. CCC2.4]